MLQVESQLECTERERDKTIVTAENAAASVEEIRAQTLSLTNEFEVDKARLNEEIPVIEEKVGRVQRAMVRIHLLQLATAISSCEQILADCYVTRAQRDENEQEFMRKQEDIKTRLEQAQTEVPYLS